MMNRVKIPVPARKHVILAKLGGGAMWFWVLWRLKHDWRTLYGHYNPADAWTIPDPNAPPAHH